MIKLIYGPKGSGKTKRVIDAANDAAMTSDGDVVFLTDQPKHSREIKHTVRFVDFSVFEIKSQEAALGFIKGILSVNNDIMEIYIDGLARMTGSNINDMENFYKELDRLGISEKVDFTLTVSCEELPLFMRKYA